MTDLPRLTQALVVSPELQRRENLNPPLPGLLHLPERVLQFGSGRFLRGFADYFIDRANRQGLFDGRVVVVQSTGTRRSEGLDAQDGLYTLLVQGLSEGQAVEQYTIIGSISRALSANEAWADVLACARNPDLVCILSNTTEVGIRLDPEDAPDLNPPRSFPGKLTAFLYERARAFDYDPARGLVVLPCELIEANGAVLKGIVRDLARRWELDARFLAWLDEATLFPNTLVDRIVTGTPAEEAHRALEAQLGYEDRLLTIAEVYRLWAIEGDESLRRRLPFLQADPGIVVAGDITPYRELKVRILNGTHTVMVEMSYLCGNDTVLGSLQDELVAGFVRGVVFDEIVPSLDVLQQEARRFAEAVLDRFSNPFIEHLLLNITFQATSKMRHRVVPSLLGYHAKRGSLPPRILFGFASYLFFMRGVTQEDGVVYGQRGESRYALHDDHAAYFFAQWQGVDPGEAGDLRRLVERVCADEALWGADLTALPGLTETVGRYLTRLVQDGPREALQEMQAELASAGA